MTLLRHATRFINTYTSHVHPAIPSNRLSPTAAYHTSHHSYATSCYTASTADKLPLIDSSHHDSLSVMPLQRVCSTWEGTHVDESPTTGGLNWRFGLLAFAAAAALPDEWRPNVMCAAEEELGGRRLYVYSWGCGLQGQLGHGDYSNQAYPLQVERFTLDDEEYMVKCCAGRYSSACFSNKGKLFTWGKTDDNLLGHDGSTRNTAGLQSTPKETEYFIDRDIRVTEVANGNGHMLALTEDGSVYSWGSNAHGQCGRVLTDISDDASTSLWSRRSSSNGMKVGKVGGVLEGKTVVQIACGKMHSMALTADGHLYGWGLNRDGQLGTAETGVVRQPIEIDISYVQGRIMQISCGNTYSALLTEEGRVYTWGADDYGQLGHGKESRYVYHPKLVRGLKSQTVVGMSCGDYHVGVVTTNGEVFTWGYGRDGQCGHGDAADMSLPKRVESLKPLKAKSISCGGAHTAVLLEDGRLFMYGRGREGQLGRAANLESIAMYRSTPVEVEQFSTKGLHVHTVHCGGDHCLAVATGASNAELRTHK